jgi:tetratricopeptide (TPR) repeat protein
MCSSDTISKAPFVLLLLFLLLAGDASAQGATNRSSISGFVFGPNRQPVGQVIVELRGEFSTIGRTRTDGSGRFYFPGLPQGRYTIRVLPLGTPLEEKSEDVEIAGLGARGRPLSDNIQQDVYLRPRRDAGATPFQNAVVYAQEVPKEAEALYKRAEEDLNSQRVQSGIVNLEKAVDTFPTYFLALQRLGIIRLQQERYEEAAGVFVKALAINDRCFDCWYGIAYANYAVRRFPESVGASEKAIALKGDSVEANLLLGMAHRLNKNFPKAEQAMKIAAKNSEGNSADVHWNLALLYGKDMNKFAEAAKELEAFLKLSPDAPNKEDIKKLIKQFKDKAATQS